MDNFFFSKKPFFDGIMIFIGFFLKAAVKV